MMVRFSQILAFSLSIAVFAAVSPVFGQGLGDLGGDLGGDIGGDLTEQQLTDQIVDALDEGGGPANTTNGGGLGSTGGGAPGIGTPAENSTFDMEVEVPQDQRNSRGFVGISLIDTDDALEFKFVGPRAAESSGAGARPLTNFGRGGGGFGGSNVTSGVFVNRGNPVRTRLVPRFQARTVSPVAVASRFNSRLQSLPINQSSRSSMRVVMQGDTAVIRGNAENREQMMKIARQLRLEPGVSRIVSQVSINP